MKRAVVILAILFSCLAARGQQHALYSQYIFNLYAVNPAYAGERDAISTATSYRAQWVGFDGAPSTANLSAHSPILNQNLALGVWFQNDQIGAREHTSFRATVSYKLRFTENRRLSFALNAGGLNHRFDWNALDFPDGADPVAFETEENIWRPAFDFGVMYLTTTSYVGLSIINVNAVDLAESTAVDARLEPKFNIIGGHVFELSQKVDLKPSALVRVGAGDSWQFDLNMSARFANSFWLTTTYRYNFGMVFSGHFYLNKHLHFGYAYDLPTNNLLSQQSGSHEIFIGYDFSLYQKPTKSPRNF